MKIVTYIILKSLNPETIENEVSRLIRDGYQPYGSIAAAHAEGGGTLYIQPMVRYEE